MIAIGKVSKYNSYLLTGGAACRMHFDTEYLGQHAEADLAHYIRHFGSSLALVMDVERHHCHRRRKRHNRYRDAVI